MSIAFNDGNTPRAGSSTWELLCKILLVLNNSSIFNSISNVVTGSTTLSSSNIYQVNTSAGVVTVTLPASPSVGNTLYIEDAALSWGTHNLTINRNGSNINSAATNYTANVNGGKLSVSYINSTIGWSIK